MNKKFTMMVAALLATGGFSAFAGNVKTTDLTPVTLDKLVSGTYYHVMADATTANQQIDNSDIMLGIGAKAGVFSNVTAPSGSFANVDNNKYIWKATVRVDNKTKAKYVTLTNVETNLPLAYNPSTGNFATEAEYTDGSILVTEFKVNGHKLEYVTGKAINIAASASVTMGAGTELIFATAVNIVANTDDLQKMGAGVSYTTDETIEGSDLFAKVTPVKVEANVVEGYNSAINVTQFLLQVSEAKVTNYTANDKDAFAAAEFIVLSNDTILKDNVLTDDDYKKGYGFAYKKVKGAQLINGGTGSTEVKENFYPIQNAIFSALTNSNKPGKTAFKHSAGLFYDNKAEDGAKWTSCKSADVYVSYGSYLNKLVLASNSNITWGSLGLGSVVKVNELVKAYTVVNIAGTVENTTDLRTDAILISKQVVGGAAGFTTETAETEKCKNEIFAQWVVSANENNTVTFINRETGVKILDVTLFETKTPGLYATVGASQFANRYIKFYPVENINQFDGYLKLDEEGLSNEYSLSVSVDDNFAGVELPVVAHTDNNTIMKGATEAEPMTFTLSEAKVTNNGKEKLDTLFLNIYNYKYYNNGELVEKADTLKAIRYNMTVGEKVVNNTFVLAAETPGAFVFRKSGEGYQIALDVNGGKTDGTDVYKAANFVKENSSVFNFTSGNLSAAQLFNLNAKSTGTAYEMPENHVALEINGLYLGANANGNGIMTSDTAMLKFANVDSSFSFWAYSADKDAAVIPSYYLSTNGKIMNNPSAKIKELEEKIAACTSIFDKEEKEKLEAELATYLYQDQKVLKFNAAKYENAEALVAGNDTIKGDALKAYKFKAYDVDGNLTLKNVETSEYVAVINGKAVLSNEVPAAKFTVVAAEAPTSNESVATTEVKVIAQNGAVNVKNAAGKNVVVSTILGQVVVNEVLTSDNATINVPAGIVVVSVDGESFKVNVR